MYKFNNMEEVEGIILVLSCQKHMNTRLKEFKLNKNEYIGWKVFYVIGDLFLKNEYEIKDTNYSFVIKYLINETKSVDFFVTNALGIQDMSQLIKSNDNKIGIRLNFLN